MTPALDTLRTWTRLRPVRRGDMTYNGCEDCGATHGEPCADGCEIGEALRVVEEALDMLAEAFVENGCDGKEGLEEGMNCISCRAVELLRKAGRR